MKQTKLEKFKALFPLKGKVTKEILKKGIRMHSGKCYGALTLKAALGANIKLISTPSSLWAVTDGSVDIGKDIVNITTKSKVDFMELTKPRNVTFIIQK